MAIPAPTGSTSRGASTGGSFRDGPDKYFVKGVTYGPFADRQSRRAPFPEPDGGHARLRG